MVSRRGLAAPVDGDFATWADRCFGEEAARTAAGLVSVCTYEADRGRRSAAFVWERFPPATAPRYPAAVRYVSGGSGAVIARMADRGRAPGVRASN